MGFGRVQPADHPWKRNFSEKKAAEDRQRRKEQLLYQLTPMTPRIKGKNEPKR